MEARRHARYLIWFPVDVEADGEKRTLAVAKDASQSGIAISTPTGLSNGQKVTLTFRVPPGTGTEQTVTGTIVRHEPNPDDPNGMWPFRVAVQFDQTLPELEEALRAAGTKAEKVPD